MDIRFRCYSLLVAAALLGGCSVHAHIGATPAISKDDLGRQVKQKLEAQAGRKADSVVCDGDLPAKVGATQHCVLTVDQTRLGVAVKATDVDTAGQTVNFHIKVDDHPLR